MRGIRIKLNDFNEFEQLCMNLYKVDSHYGIFWSNVFIDEIFAFAINNTNRKEIIVNKLELQNSELTKKMGINTNAHLMYDCLKNYSFGDIYSIYLINSYKSANTFNKGITDYSLIYEDYEHGKSMERLAKSSNMNHNRDAIRIFNNAKDMKLYSHFSTIKIEFPVDLGHTGIQEYNFDIQTDKNHNIYLEGRYENDSYEHNDGHSTYNSDIENRKPLDFIRSRFELLGFDPERAEGLGS